MGLDNPLHILFILVLVLLVFGAKRLPEMGRSLGEGMRGFKDSLSPHPPVSQLNPMPVPTSPITSSESLAVPSQVTAETVNPVGREA